MNVSSPFNYLTKGIYFEFVKLFIQMKMWICQKFV